MAAMVAAAAIVDENSMGPRMISIPPGMMDDDLAAVGPRPQRRVSPGGRSKYMPHIGAKQRAKGAKRAATFVGRTPQPNPDGASD